MGEFYPALRYNATEDLFRSRERIEIVEVRCIAVKKLAAALVVVMLMTGSAMAADTIKIGVYLPLTGGNAIGGQLELDGVKLAHKVAPEVLGRKIELVIVDNKSDKVESANAVKRLIEKEKVNAIVGTYSSFPCLPWQAAKLWKGERSLW